MTSNLPLSCYEYVHLCLKMNTDIHFQMMRQQDIPRKLLRTVSKENSSQFMSFAKFVL